MGNDMQGLYAVQTREIIEEGEELYQHLTTTQDLSFSDGMALIQKSFEESGGRVSAAVIRRQE